jgi:hypothetical protein
MNKLPSFLPCNKCGQLLPVHWEAEYQGEEIPFAIGVSSCGCCKSYSINVLGPPSFVDEVQQNFSQQGINGDRKRFLGFHELKQAFDDALKGGCSSMFIHRNKVGAKRASARAVGGTG